jgi:hypothetical protein
VAERRGTGLQNLIRRFNSVHDLFLIWQAIEDGTVFLYGPFLCARDADAAFTLVPENIQTLALCALKEISVQAVERPDRLADEWFAGSETGSFEVGNRVIVLISDGDEVKPGASPVMIFFCFSHKRISNLHCFCKVDGCI